MKPLALSLLCLRTTMLTTLLGCGSALAQVTLIMGGTTSTPRSSTTPQGIEMVVGGGASTETLRTPTPMLLEQVMPPPVFRRPMQRHDTHLVSPRLVVAPGQQAIMRPADLRRVDVRMYDDERVAILTQELAHESKELNAKQHQLQSSKNPLSDDLRGRIKEEVQRHAQNLAGIQREIDRVVRESRPKKVERL